MAVYIQSSDPADIVGAVRGLEPTADKAVFLLVAEEEQPDLEELVAAMRRTGLPFAGGVFPGVIHGRTRHVRGTVALSLPVLEPPLLIQGLDGDHPEFPPLPDEELAATDGRLTALLLVDGMAPNIAAFLQNLFNRLGNSVSYLGGGAGSAALKPEPYLFCKDGVFRHAALLTFVALESHLGVRHGWEHVAGPVVATTAQRNCVSGLNWRNAFSVYAEAVEKDSGRSLTRENFFDLSQAYPFGMYREGVEDIVRDPVTSTPEGELMCLGEVPENTVLSILKGETESLIEAAGRATDDCLESYDGGLRQALIIDCFSRAIFLEKDFSRELAAVEDRILGIDGHRPPVGILSLGEISSYGEEFLEFFNKTIVVGLLCDKRSRRRDPE